MSNRREFIKQAGLATIGLGISQLLPKWIIAATSKQIVHSTIIRLLLNSSLV
jgi:hypothetical protein